MSMVTSSLGGYRGVTTEQAVKQVDLFPFCTVADVEARMRQFVPNFSANTRPTKNQVRQFIHEAAARMRLAMMQGGYDMNNIGVDRGVASSDWSGTTINIDTEAAEIILADNIETGDEILVSGIDSNNDIVVEWKTVLNESATDNVVTSLLLDSGPTLTINSGAAVFVANNSLVFLRGLNADCATVKALQVSMQGRNPNKSELAGTLINDCETRINAIAMVPGYLWDETRLQTAQKTFEHDTSSYLSDNIIIEPEFVEDELF